MPVREMPYGPFNSYQSSNVIRGKEKSREFRLTEGEILKLIIKEISNRQIADKLAIQKRAVVNHVANILNTIRVQNRTEAVKFDSVRIF